MYTPHRRPARLSAPCVLAVLALVALSAYHARWVVADAPPVAPTTLPLGVAAPAGRSDASIIERPARVAPTDADSQRHTGSLAAVAGEQAEDRIAAVGRFFDAMNAGDLEGAAASFGG